MNKFKVIEEDKELDELFGDEDEEEDDDDDKDDKDDQDKKDDKDYKGDDDDDQGATGLLISKSSSLSTIEDFLNDKLNEQHEEDQHLEGSSSGTKHVVDEVFLILPKVIYLHHAEEDGELDENWTRESMLEELDMDDGKLKFDIEEEIPPTPDREYSFKFVNEANNFNDVILEEGSKSDEDTPFRYSGVDDDFPTLNELFQSHNKDEVRRKVVEKIASEGVLETFFTDHPDKSLGDILSWGYLEDLKVYAIRREFGVQYFEFLANIKTLPWWDVEDLVQTQNIKQYYYGLEVKCHEQKLWDYIKLQAKSNFPDWKPHQPKQIVKVDSVTGEKDITLKIRRPRCLRNLPLRAMEQDFYKDIKRWIYNQSTAEAVITLFDVKTGDCRRINVLDLMWLETKFRDLELEEFLKTERRSERIKDIKAKAAQRGRSKLAWPDTDQTSIESQEKKIPRWSKARDGDPEYRKWWNETGRPLRRRMLEERKEERRRKVRDRRRNRKVR
ncbi:hypothetical protein Hanom_Chr07g00626471 [Helianthus anomalus]